MGAEGGEGAGTVSWKKQDGRDFQGHSDGLPQAAEFFPAWASDSWKVTITKPLSFKPSQLLALHRLAVIMSSGREGLMWGRGKWTKGARVGHA